MKNQLIWVFALISAASCSQLQILSSPKSIEFKGANDLPSESLSDVFAATLGYSVSSSLKWNGLFINDPFNTAEAVIAMVVEGLENLKNDNAKTFNLIGNPDFAETLESKAMEHSHLAYEVELSGKIDESVMTPFGELSASSAVKEVNYLKPQTSRYDLEFLNQIALLDSLTEQMTQEKELPSALIARVSLKFIVAEHGGSSLAVAEAKKILQASIDSLNREVNKVYRSNAVFAVVLVDEHSVSRSKRQTVPEAEQDYNLAPIYSKYYPVMFNIILWFTVVLFFSLLAISLAISGMEDKDSIIYRMTSTRMKKDN